METAADLALGKDIRQAGAYRKFMERIGWHVEEVDWKGGSCQIFIRHLWPASIAKIQRVNLPIPWERVHAVLKKHKVMMCKIEPNHQSTQDQISKLRALGFKQDNWPMLGTKTMFVDLRPAEATLFEGLGSDTRYKLRKLQKNTHHIELNNHDEFYSIFKKAFAIKGVWMPPRDQYDHLVNSFGGQCFCMTIDHTSGCLVLLNGSLASYFYGATLPEGKEHNTPYLLIWEAMLEAKKRNATVWEFEGIYDPRWPNKGWRGFSYFKERFRGEIVDFPGSFQRWSLRDIF